MTQERNMENKTNVENKANLPEKKFRAGAISATIWRNVSEKDGMTREWRSVKFERHYKEKDSDEWKTTSNLRAMDLPKAVVVLNKAFEYLIMNGQVEA